MGKKGGGGKGADGKPVVEFDLIFPGWSSVDRVDIERV